MDRFLRDACCTKVERRYRERPVLQWKERQKNERPVAESWSRLDDKLAVARLLRSIPIEGRTPYNAQAAAANRFALLRTEIR
jgi:hypothetical protein